ncbi:MAG TPA: DUF6600 domain-containing protein [Terracidiphilus sp.]
MFLGCVAAVAQDDQDPPPEAGRLSAITGNVSVQPAGAQDWGQAYANLPLGPGDRIYTDASSRAEIQVGQTYIRLGPNSDVTLVDATNEAITVGVGAGSLDVHTFGLWQNQQLQIQTPSGTGTVYGPTDFRADVYAPNDQENQEPSAAFTPVNGSVDVSGADGVGATVQAGQSFALAGTNPVDPQWLEPPAPDDLDQWSRMRDRQVSQARSYQYVSRGIPGGYELDQAGQWQTGTEYGNVWFPRVDQDWAPYRNGHWIDRDPWGWVWVEDESWGYAPFHYGRWVNYQGRWGWIPGPAQEHPVWSPALVVFAGGIQAGGGDLSAWIPLGPGEPYRPWYPCSPRYVDRVNITNIQPAPRVHVRTTYVNITNVTNITYVNRTVGTTAVPREAFATGRPIRQAVVRVTPQQLQQARVEERPAVQPNRAAMIARPVVKPVPVKARPVLINAKGQAVAAKPHAQPEAPPVRQRAAAPRPIPGRKTVAPPANAKMTPAARQAAKARPAQGVAGGQGQQPNAQGRPQPGNQPGNRPGNQPGNQGNPNIARPGSQPGVNQPGAKPGNQPKNQPNARPGNQPGAEPGARPGTQPGAQQRPGTQPQPGVQPGQRPAIPPQTARPGPQEPQRPGVTPQRPGQPPAAGPEQRPGPPAARPPQDQSRPEHPGVTPQRPGAEPQPNAQPHPTAPPSARPAPQQRPARPPERPEPAPQHQTPESRQSPPAERPAQPAARPENRPQQRPQQPAARPGAQPENHPKAEPQPDKNKPKKPEQIPPQ